MQKLTGPMGRQWLTVAAVLLAIAINALSNFYPPAGKNIGEVSNTTFAAVLITPAGYAFAIWGLIYIGLIAFSIYQALPAQRHQAAIAQVSWAVIGACLLQILWVYAFLTARFWLSVALMLGILVCLMAAYVQTRSVRPSRSVRWLLRSPISIYFSWITVAAVVNVSSALVISLPPVWSTVFTGSVGLTAVMMLVSAGLAATVALKYRDVAYLAVTVWALSAIAVRQSGILLLVCLGVTLAIVLSVVIGRIVTTGSRRKQPETS